MSPAHSTSAPPQPPAHADRVARFIEDLAADAPAGCFNPWSETSPGEAEAGAAARRARLHAHLACPRVDLILVGEAAGYRGCRYSGIPFTSERLLLAGSVPRLPPLEQRISRRLRPWTEPSATVVWGALHDLGVAATTVLWNAVPWHPEGAGGPHSNRKPTAAERRAGLPWLEVILSLYPKAAVFAVGSTAAHSLQRLDAAFQRLRHPAHGGATRFRRGLTSALGRT